MKLSDRVTQLAESATLAVATQAAKLRKQGVDVIGFGAGEPDFDTPASIKEAAAKAIAAGHTKYSKPASGLADAKAAIVRKFERDNQLHYSSDQIMITAGGKMGVYLAMQAVLDPGDEVVIPKPYWVSYPEIVKLAGAQPVYAVGCAEDDYKLSPEDLEKAITLRTRMFVMNSPSNPSGVTYSPDDIRGLAEVLADKDIVVISDEIYDRLLYDGQSTLSYATASDKAFAKTITLNAASKTYAMTGWRVGYAAGPVDIIKAMSKLQSQMTSGAVTFNQIALTSALDGDQSAVEKMRDAFEQRSHYMYERLISMPGVSCPKPTGAFYCFPNVSKSYDKLGVSSSIEFAKRLLDDAKVAVVPGAAFGMDEHVRLSFATSMELITEGLDRIAAFLS